MGESVAKSKPERGDSIGKFDILAADIRAGPIPEELVQAGLSRDEVKEAVAIPARWRAEAGSEPFQGGAVRSTSS